MKVVITMIEASWLNSFLANIEIENIPTQM